MPSQVEKDKFGWGQGHRPPPNVGTSASPLCPQRQNSGRDGDESWGQCGHVGAGPLTSEGGWPYQSGGTVPFTSSTEHSAWLEGPIRTRQGWGNGQLMLSSVVRVACVSIRRRNEAWRDLTRTSG